MTKKLKQTTATKIRFKKVKPCSPGKDKSLRVKQANFVMSNRASDGVMDDETGELVEY